jgi:hypothetical protein
MVHRSRILENKPLSKLVSLSDSDTLKVTLTTQEGGSAKRPHQAFLLLKDFETGLDVSYPFAVKNNGKAKLEVVSHVHNLHQSVTANITPLTDPERPASSIP